MHKHLPCDWMVWGVFSAISFRFNRWIHNKTINKWLEWTVWLHFSTPGKKAIAWRKIKHKRSSDSFDATMAQFETSLTQFEAEEKLHKKDCDTDVPRNQYIPLRLCIFGAGMSLTQIRWLANQTGEAVRSPAISESGVNSLSEIIYLLVGWTYQFSNTAWIRSNEEPFVFLCRFNFCFFLFQCHALKISTGIFCSCCVLSERTLVSLIEN